MGGGKKAGDGSEERALSLQKHLQFLDAQSTHVDPEQSAARNSRSGPHVVHRSFFLLLASEQSSGTGKQGTALRLRHPPGLASKC